MNINEFQGSNDAGHYSCHLFAKNNKSIKIIVFLSLLEKYNLRILEIFLRPNV